jgi:hypothetical protein
MPWNVFLLPLLGGFLFLDWCYYTRLRHQRLEGNRLLIESAFVAALAAFIATIIISAVEHPTTTVSILAHGRLLIGSIVIAGVIASPYFRKFPLSNPPNHGERIIKTAVAGLSIPSVIWIVVWVCKYPEFLKRVAHDWGAIIPFDYSGTASVAMLLGISAAGLINYLSDYDGTAANVAEQSGDYILSLCFKAVQKEKPLTLILSNGRTYTGYVVLSPNLKPESQIALILAAAGHMPKESPLPNWDAFYLPHWDKDPVKAAEFIVTIPTRLIDHAHIATKELDHRKIIASAAAIAPSAG